VNTTAGLVEICAPNKHSLQGACAIATNCVIDNDKLLLSALEDLRPDQVAVLFHLSKTQDTPIERVIVDALRLYLQRIGWHERDLWIHAALLEVCNFDHRVAGPTLLRSTPR
jgi:hypothetical protein